ncbi:MAG: hypothetical protein NVS9B13_24180 [Candidatus Acidiferrum sp.]
MSFCTVRREIFDSRALPLPPKNTYEWQTQGLLRKTGAVEEGKEVAEVKEAEERMGTGRSMGHGSKG